MNAKHFNGELKKVIDRGVTEGVFAGEMSFAEDEKKYYRS